MESQWRHRLRAAITQRDTSMKAVSKAAGLGDTYVRDLLERNREPTVENALAICRILDTSFDVIFGNEGDPEEATDVLPTMPLSTVVEVSGSEFARLAIFDIRFAAGAGTQNYDETPIGFHLVDMHFLRNITDAPISMLAGFQASGDSMEPTIYDGDWVFVDLRRKSLVNPGIFALVYEGEGFLKRAMQHIESKAVTLISDNIAYKPRYQTIKRPERLEVVGRVFMSLRRH